MSSKGYKHTQEWKEKMSARMKGHKSFMPEWYEAWNKWIKWATNNGSFKKWHNLGMTGKKHTKETINKISISNTGVSPSEQSKEKNRIAHLGKMVGAQNHKWKWGITPINKKIRASSEMKIWRKSVFERDDYTCVFCGVRWVELNADHIKRFCDYPDLRYDIGNGRTLCVSCHKKTDTYWTKWWKKYTNQTIYAI